MLSECKSDDACKHDYPSFPICDLEDSKFCIQIPHELKPPKTFDKDDLCKKAYGITYVYDVEVKACRVPKCNVVEDNHCPEPSKCWRGKEVFIYVIVCL